MRTSSEAALTGDPPSIAKSFIARPNPFTDATDLAFSLGAGAELRCTSSMFARARSRGSRRDSWRQAHMNAMGWTRPDRPAGRAGTLFRAGRERGTRHRERE